jgi:hypothetical protein
MVQSAMRLELLAETKANSALDKRYAFHMEYQ